MHIFSSSSRLVGRKAQPDAYTLLFISIISVMLDLLHLRLCCWKTYEGVAPVLLFELPGT